MPKKVRLGIAGVSIQIEDKPFAAGGEGELYHIISPAKYRSSVAKIYFPEKRTIKQAKKIQYLIQNPPELALHEGHQAVVWLQDSVYENDTFLGFIMPFAKGAKLEILCSNRIPKSYINSWKRFSLKQSASRDLRLKICFNIATAVYQIHKTQKYVLVDLKPENVIIQPNGLVSIVDIDSVQVVENGRLVYPARVATPEFSPPEYYGEAKPGKTIIFETWDRFSLAVIFYKMLFGIHPYAGSSLPPLDKHVSLQDKIEHGLFVHSPAKKQSFKVIPPPHQAFYDLPVHLQNLFIRCFDYGHTNLYERPTANEWCWGTTPRPPLIAMRKLPSMALPMQAIQYTPAISLSSSDANIQLPNLQASPPPNFRYKRFKNDKLGITKITAASVVLLSILWVWIRPVPFSSITFVQLLSIFGTGGLIAAVDYYSLPIVKDKSLAEAFKKKVGNQKREKRQAITNKIRNIQRLPQTEKETQNAFYQSQSKILQEERVEVDKIVGKYRQFVAKKDQEVLKLNQNELDKVQAIEQNLTSSLNLAAIKEISFLPLPEKVIWLKQKIERPDLDDSKEFLTSLSALQKGLERAGEKFDIERKKVSEF